MKILDCIFCDKRIISQGLIFQSNSEYVLYSIRKSNIGRVTVIPKRHVTNMREMSEDEIKNFFITVRYVSEILKNELKPIGFNYGLNEGEIAGQTIDHLHFHIIPRYKNDGLMEIHLFHGDKKIQKNWREDEYSNLVNRFKAFFKS